MADHQHPLALIRQASQPLEKRLPLEGIEIIVKLYPIGHSDAGQHAVHGLKGLQAALGAADVDVSLQCTPSLQRDGHRLSLMPASPPHGPPMIGQVGT